MQSEAQLNELIEQLRRRVGCAPEQALQYRASAHRRARRVLPDDLVVAGDQTAALRRFIVARKGDVEKAEEQLRRALEWRNEYGVLALLVRSRAAAARAARAPALTRPARRPSRPGSGWSWCAR